MQRLTMMVTPEGEWMKPDSEEFLAALGDPNPDYDAVAFAVKNLGFIKFELIGKTIIEIELHPRNTDLMALLAVQQQLISSKVNLFRIRYLDSIWHSEISSDAEKTISRLSELCAPVFNEPTSDRYRAEPRDISLLFDDETNPLRPLAQKWRMSFGVFDPSVISLAIRHQLLPRFIIAGVKLPTSDPVFRFVGDGHGWMGEYRTCGIGEKISNFPDSDYGAWVAEFYRTVGTSGQPRYDFVTGAVRYENEPGKPLKQVHYERLMLPWRTSSNEVFVTGCTRKVGTDDIPAFNRSPDRDAMTSAMSS